ncbi:MAG TPA: SLBB domain-containing protein [Steroidobacteraceae bacterium]|nr:SLBB domain-containing protein [Steroidobacteraceae bacterium]
MSSRSVILNSGLWLLIWSVCSLSVNAAQSPSASDPPAPAIDAAPRIIQLGPGDSVSIQVYGQPDMTTTVYVSDDGTIPVPLAGPVQIAGLSPAEASQRIEKALKDGRFLVDPHVTLTVTVSRSQRISVLGQVGKPGVYPIESNTSIFDLLAMAGGALETGSDEIFLLRKDAAGTLQRYPINLKGLNDPKNAVPAQALRGGDSILVPRAEQFYIYGEVASPKKYRVEPGMTVVQAIAVAGGVTARGSERRVDIKRLVADGKYVTVKAKLSDLVKPDDVIHVKESIF